MDKHCTSRSCRGNIQGSMTQHDMATNGKRHHLGSNNSDYIGWTALAGRYGAQVILILVSPLCPAAESHVSDAHL